MNLPIVKQLVLKDLYLNRGLTVRYLVGGILLGAFFYLMGEVGYVNRSGRGLLTITLHIMVVAFAFHILIATVLREHERGTLPFMLSLPISTSDYTLAKIIANLTMFFAVWAPLPIWWFVLFSSSEIDIQNNEAIFAIVLLGVPFLVFCIALAVALITESLGWVVFTIAMGAVFYNRILVRYSDNWGTLNAETLIGLEVAVALIVLSATFYFQNKKTDFI